VGADKGIYLFTQLTGVSTKEYFEQFKALVDTDESYVSSPGHSKALVDAQKREAVEFKPHKKGLHYLDMSVQRNKEIVFAQAKVPTVCKNFEGFIPS
jgi:hypothetical protein